MPETESLENAFVSTASGRVYQVRLGNSEASARLDPGDIGIMPAYQSDAAASAPTGVIYTSRADMPALEDLLREHQIATAVLERESRRTTPDAWRVILATTAAAGILAVGLTLFVVNLVAPVTPNPFTALFLALAGAVLVSTVVLASRRKPG
jgi:anti-sigma-K factor RskA